MGRVVAGAPRALARSRHHVEVVQVVSRGGHRRPVPAVRDQDDVAGPDRREQVDRAIGRAVDMLVREPGARRTIRHDVVVDLFELGLVLAHLIVLVGWIRAPVAARAQHFDRDEPVRIEPVRPREVADLAGADARPAQLDADRRCRDVAHRVARLGAGGRDREPPTGRALDLDRGARGRIEEVGRAGPDARPTGQAVALAVGHDVERPLEREHGDLVGAGVERQRTARFEGADAQPREAPARRLGCQDDGPAVRRQRSGGPVEARRDLGHDGVARSGFGTSASATWWSSS